jgi:peptidoglycan-associated lipoprotein
MQKFVPIYVVSLLLVAAFMTAGCAKQDLVKKDESVVPAQELVLESALSKQPKPEITTPKQDDSSSAPQIVTLPDTAKLTPESPVNARLQSALDKIYYNFDSAALSESARSTLSKNADSMMKHPASKINIEGNCDERGSAEYNLALGERRAKAARQYLVTLGIEPGRLSTISYGKEKPALQGNGEEAWAKNRRAEFVIETP